MWTPGASRSAVEAAIRTHARAAHQRRRSGRIDSALQHAQQAEQQAFVAAHPNLYGKMPGRPARLKAKGGKIALGSLGCPGFAVGVDLDFKAMRPMPAAPKEKLVPAGAKK